MMQTTKTVALLLFSSLLGVSTVYSRQADVETGTRTGAETIRLAIPEFVLESAGGTAAELSRVFNETLWNDLDFSGVVVPISRSFYPLGRFGEPLDIVAEEWTEPGIDAQFLTFGNATLRGQDFVIEGYLWDLKTRAQDRETFSRRFTTASTEPAVRRMAHQYADLVVDALGGGLRGIFQTQIAFESTRTTPPDEVRVKEIFVMDYDGYNQYQVTTAYQVAATVNGAVALAVTPSWSPDNRQIAYTSYARGKADIALISPVDRRGFPFPEFAETNTTPSWSSDGTRIAYMSSKGTVRGQPDPEIYIYDTRFGTESRLTNYPGVDISPVWNPATNNQIAFQSDRSGVPQLFIVDADGGNLRRIETPGGEAASPAWSPDGRTIAFAWLRPESVNRNIYVYDVATRRISQVTPEGSGENDNPTWSPDGRHLAFESNRSGSTQIYSMLANGRGRARQLTSAGSNHNPAWSNYPAR